MESRKVKKRIMRIVENDKQRNIIRVYTQVLFSGVNEELNFPSSGHSILKAMTQSIYIICSVRNRISRIRDIQLHIFNSVIHNTKIVYYYITILLYYMLISVTLNDYPRSIIHGIYFIRIHNAYKPVNR